MCTTFFIPFVMTFVYVNTLFLPDKYCMKNIDQTLVSSLHRLLNCQIGGLDCRVITTEYRTILCPLNTHVIPFL